MLTVEQVARELKLTTRTIHRYIKDGKISVIRLSSRAIRISEKELKRLKGE